MRGLPPFFRLCGFLPPLHMNGATVEWKQFVACMSRNAPTPCKGGLRARQGRPAGHDTTASPHDGNDVENRVYDRVEEVGDALREPLAARAGVARHPFGQETVSELPKQSSWLSGLNPPMMMGGEPARACRFSGLRPTR